MLYVFGQVEVISHKRDRCRLERVPDESGFSAKSSCNALIDRRGANEEQPLSAEGFALQYLALVHKLRQDALVHVFPVQADRGLDDVALVTQKRGSARSIVSSRVNGLHF